MASGTRNRNLTRKFIFLRWVDPLRVPPARTLDALERSGRVKDVVFSNNSTKDHVTELLVHAFQQQLVVADMPRLLFYKPVGSTSILSQVASGGDICGPTLKQHFKNRKKIYIRLRIGDQDQGEQDQVEESIAEEEAGQQATETAEGETEESPPILDDSDNEVTETANPGPSRQRDTSGYNRISRQVTVEVSDDEESLHPRLQSSPIQSQLLSGSDMFTVERLVKRSYDKIVKVPMLRIACRENDSPSWEKDATEVGEIEENPDLLTAAEIDEKSGPSFDVRVFETFLRANNMQQRLLLLCLTAEQMRLQSHWDTVPVCLLRYRLTNRSAEQLRTLITNKDLMERLRSCYVHVALMGSEFDQQACGNQRNMLGMPDLEVRVLQPTMSSARFIVSNVMEGHEISHYLGEAVQEACQAAQAVQAQRELIQRDRAIREEQDRQLKQSECVDRQKRDKSANQRDSANHDGESLDERVVDSEESSLDDTVPDDDEVRKRRLATLDAQGEASKRPRGDGDDENNTSKDSGTVTMKKT